MSGMDQTHDKLLQSFPYSFHVEPNDGIFVRCTPSPSGNGREFVCSSVPRLPEF
jgi:hypothetical protein